MVTAGDNVSAFSRAAYDHDVLSSMSNFGSESPKWRETQQQIVPELQQQYTTPAEEVMASGEP